MLHPAYPVRTGRLLLRPYTKADGPAALDFLSRPEVTRYLPFEPFTEASWPAALAQKYAKVSLEAEGDSLNLAVALAGTDRLVGEVYLFWRSEANRQGEIGYVFHPEHQGRGYATEAAAALLGLAFDGAGLHRVFARIDARNSASAAVLERLGMRREAHLVENAWDGEWTDEVVYGLLAREWAARRSRPAPSGGPSVSHR